MITMTQEQISLWNSTSMALIQAMLVETIKQELIPLNAAGQGVRFDRTTNAFKGFLEAARATQ